MNIISCFVFYFNVPNFFSLLTVELKEYIDDFAPRKINWSDPLRNDEGQLVDI